MIEPACACAAHATWQNEWSKPLALQLTKQLPAARPVELQGAPPALAKGFARLLDTLILPSRCRRALDVRFTWRGLHPVAALLAEGRSQDCQRVAAWLPVTHNDVYSQTRT